MPRSRAIRLVLSGLKVSFAFCHLCAVLQNQALICRVQTGLRPLALVFWLSIVCKGFEQLHFVQNFDKVAV